MSYRRAEKILPIEIIRLIQDYVDGECIYIPRKENARREWGQGTKIREELEDRNTRIYVDYQRGMKVTDIANKYYLSEKSIERIIRQYKN